MALAPIDGGSAGDGHFKKIEREGTNGLFGWEEKMRRKKMKRKKIERKKMKRKVCFIFMCLDKEKMKRKWRERK